MNILYISSKKRWGGVVSWMEKTASALENRGHKVWILLHPDSLQNKSSQKKSRLLLKKLGPEYNPFMIAWIVFFVKKNKIELIVTNIEKEIGIGGIAAKICKIPNVRRVGREDDFFKRYKTKWNHQHLVTKSIVPCEDLKQNVIKRAAWLSENDFVTIYNGRNPQDFSADEILLTRQSWGINNKDVVIGITAQFLAVKQIDQIIILFKKLSEKNPQIKLVITGSGREEKNLKEQTVALRIADKVIFPGFTSDPVRTASGYDIGILNSRIEGFPNTIVEYFAASRPVVSTDVGGVREIVKDGENGYLVPINDLDTFYSRLDVLSKNENLREKFGRNARTTLTDGFSETQMIDKLEKLFKECILKNA